MDITTEAERERLEDAGLLALKMKEGVMSQGVQRASRSWKRQGERFLLEPPEAVQPSQDLDFDPVKHFGLVTSRTVRR